jgi:hypothetical protein
LLNHLYEQDEDYIDSFRPYVIKEFPGIGKPVNLSFIQRRLKEKINLKIPMYTLKTIMKRAKRKHYLEKERGEYMLTLEGQEYLNKLEIDTEVQRRMNELLTDLNLFLEEQLKTSLSIDKTQDIFLSFIQKNFEYVSDCFLYNSTSYKENLSKIDTYDRLIVDYIEIAGNQKPKISDTLKDVILGFIISSALNFEGFYDRNRKFYGEIYFDSNLIFSLLNLNYSDSTKPQNNYLIYSNSMDLI